MRTVGALLVLVFGLAASSEAAKIPGTWLFVIDVPASEFTGGEALQVPELVTFGKGGGVVVSSAMTSFLFPRNGNLNDMRPVLMGTGHANWRKQGSGFVTTNYRCLNRIRNGMLEGFVKIYVESDACGGDLCTGRWFADLLYPNLEPVIPGNDLVIEGTWVATRLQVERIPEID